jgi:hypothetical protein
MASSWGNSWGAGGGSSVAVPSQSANGFLAEKPHILTIELPATAQVPPGYEGAPHSTGSVTIYGQVTPKSMTFALNNYGVELRRPHKLMADTGEEAFLVQGARVVWSANGRERVFYIATPVRYHGQGDGCDHISVMMEEDFGGSSN